MKYLRIAVVALVATLVGGYASALNPVEVEVMAAMDSTLSLTVSSATVQDMGAFTSNEQKVTAAAFVIQNDGGGLTETLGLSAIAMDGWSLYTGVASPGADQIAADAQFNSVAPLTASFAVPADRLTGSSVPADGTAFAGDQTGQNLAFNATANLWLRITAPLSSATSTTKRVRVTVTATTP